MHIQSRMSGSAPVASLRWLGHNCFLLTSSAGTRILMDPIPKGYGYDGPPLEGVEAITITHEHPDHVNVGLAAGSPQVLRGLSGGDWARIDRKIKDVTVHTLDSYHDGAQGSQRGKNAIFIFDTDGLRIVHLGDLGHLLAPEQVAAIGAVDVVIVPVGGFYTIDAAQATQVTDQLKPLVVIPSHYKTPKLRPDWPGVGVDDFLANKRVQRVDGSTYPVAKDTLPRETTVLLLNLE